MTPDLNQLMDLIKGQKEKQTVLDKVAAQPSQGQPWRNPTDTNSAWEYAIGRGNTPAQSRGLNQLYGSILNRDRRQSAIAAASGGFEKGSQLIDEIRGKRKIEDVNSAQTAVNGAQQELKDTAAVYALKQKDEATNVDNANLRLRQGELDVKRGTLALKTDQEAWKRAHPDMSVNTEKVYREYNIQEIDSNRAANKYSSLAEQLRSAKYPGGARTWGKEQLKTVLGDQDAQTALIEAGRNLTVSEAIGSLPPGVASDKDIALVMGTVPSQFSNPEYLANYAEARARLEKINAEYAMFVQQYMEQNKDKNYSMVGVNTAWKIKNIPADKRALLERNADNPDAVAAFERIYGVSADKVLEGAQ